jgi:hypothetical protein
LNPSAAIGHCEEEKSILPVLQPIARSFDADQMKHELSTYKTVRRRKICTSLTGTESCELTQAIAEAGGKETLSTPLPPSQTYSLSTQALLFRFMDRVSSLIP